MVARYSLYVIYISIAYTHTFMSIDIFQCSPKSESSVNQPVLLRDIQRIFFTMLRSFSASNWRSFLLRPWRFTEPLNFFFLLKKKSEHNLWCKKKVSFVKEHSLKLVTILLKLWKIGGSDATHICFTFNIEIMSILWETPAPEQKYSGATCNAEVSSLPVKILRRRPF